MDNSEETMIWLYVTLIVSIAANIGLTIYIAFNYQLDKWEKQSAARNIHSRMLYKCDPLLPVDKAKQKRDFLSKGD
jgi:hypothetical protein